MLVHWSAADSIPCHMLNATYMTKHAQHAFPIQPGIWFSSALHKLHPWYWSLFCAIVQASLFTANSCSIIAGHTFVQFLTSVRPQGSQEPLQPPGMQLINHSASVMQHADPAGQVSPTSCEQQSPEPPIKVHNLASSATQQGKISNCKQQ
jgi:hypothetical protein